MQMRSFLYEARFIVLGYLFGKALSTQVTLCRVVGNSMRPTLQADHHDVVLLTAAGNRPTRGGVYVLWHPSRQYKIIKRVVGLPGDDVGTVHGNKVVVPQGYIWVEGDDAGCSEDSRMYGAVPMSSVSAAAVALLWPPSRFCMLGKK